MQKPQRAGLETLLDDSGLCKGHEYGVQAVTSARMELGR